MDNVDTDNMSTVHNMLITLNKPFLYDTWLSSIDESQKTGKPIFGLYLKSVYFNFKDWSWKDSQFEAASNVDGNNNNAIPPRLKMHTSSFTMSEEIVDKWGEGYSDEEYRLFEKKWKKLIDNYGEKTALHTEGLITYIRFRVQEELSTASKDMKGAKQWGDLASSAAKDAKLNVSQLSKSDISGGVDLLSQLFEAVETEVGVIPLLPRLLEQPYDDADMVIWSIVNYTRRLEDKPPVPYREVWNFYDDMLEEFYKQKDYKENQIKEYKEKRNNVFRDLSEVYKEPLYEGDD
jgi:hypothetical protein